MFHHFRQNGHYFFLIDTILAIFHKDGNLDVVITVLTRCKILSAIKGNTILRKSSVKQSDPKALDFILRKALIITVLLIALKENALTTLAGNKRISRTAIILMR